VWDLVVGDVVLLESGSRVPADCLIITHENLKVDEPVEGGDEAAQSSEDEARANDDNFLRAGSMVKSGHAKALVCVVGKNSTRGAKGERPNFNKDTLLELKLQNLAMQLTFYAIVSTAVIAVALIIAYFIKVAKSESPFATFLG
jgi:Ca2+-transporting ATPase